MNIKLLIISTLYTEYLKSYYQRFPNITLENYQSQYEHLLQDAREFIAAYTKNFNQIGIITHSIITNADPLQKCWAKENGYSEKDRSGVVLQQIKKMKPDVLWLEDKTLISTSFINQMKTEYPKIKLIFGYQCAPYSSKEKEKLGLLDFILTCTPGFLQNFQHQNIKSYLVYHAFEPEVLKKLEEKTSSEMKNQVVFSGSLYLGGNYHNERIRLIEAILEQTIDLGLYVNLESRAKYLAKKIVAKGFHLLEQLKLSDFAAKFDSFQQLDHYRNKDYKYYSKKLLRAAKPPVFGLEMLQLLRNSPISLNMHLEAAGDYAGNMRLFEATGVGSCLLTDEKKNLPDLFDTNNEIVTYSGIDDCLEKIKWLIEHPDERKKIANAGQQKTLSKHTVNQRCVQIKEIIESELKKR
jgi:spore maturation protein CgeB